MGRSGGVALILLLAAASAHAQIEPDRISVAELAKRKACLSCHGIDKRIVGPAFRDVAARYKGQAGAQARLLEKLRRGGSGAWGPLPMPPNPDLPAEDAERLVKWIIDGAV